MFLFALTRDTLLGFTDFSEVAIQLPPSSIFLYRHSRNLHFPSLTMPLDFSDFFPAGVRPPQPMLGHGYLIHGARSCGKTSLAFQAAVNCVLGGGRVLVICQESSVYAKVPRPFVPLSSLPEEALTRMEFVYADCWPAAFREVAVATRRRASLPDLVLIDDDGMAMEDLGAPASAAAGTTAGPELRPGASRGHRAGGINSIAQCFSLLENITEWLSHRNGRQFTYIVTTNSSTVGGAGAGSDGGFRGAGSSYHQRQGSAVGLPLAAFPVVRIFIGSSGTVQVTPVPADRADTVCKSFSLRWDDGLQL